jgi:quinol monooxygenase YgiN
MNEDDRPLFLVVTIKPREDRLAEAEAQLQSMRRHSLTEPGCVFMHLVQPEDAPDTWLMLEMFRSRAAWDEHMQQPYNTEGNVILQELLREPSDLRLCYEKAH